MRPLLEKELKRVYVCVYYRFHLRDSKHNTDLTPRVKTFVTASALACARRAPRRREYLAPPPFLGGPFFCEKIKKKLNHFYKILTRNGLI